MKKLLLIFVFSFWLIAGCGQEQEQTFTNHSNHNTLELTYELGSKEWPEPIKIASAEVKEAYQFAVYNPEILDYIPCYCGCYEEDGHVSNTNCFVEAMEDNVAILDDMGLG